MKIWICWHSHHFGWEKWVVSSFSAQKARGLSHLCKSPRSVFFLNPNSLIPQFPFLPFFVTHFGSISPVGFDHRGCGKFLTHDSKSSTFLMRVGGRRFLCVVNRCDGIMRILGALLNLIAVLKSRKKSIELRFGVNKTIMWTCSDWFVCFRGIALLL